MKKLTRKQKIANIKKAFIERNSGKGYQHFFKDNTQGEQPYKSNLDED